jgi:hypothetical protein
LENVLAARAGGLLPYVDFAAEVDVGQIARRIAKNVGKRVVLVILSATPSFSSAHDASITSMA